MLQIISANRLTDGRIVYRKGPGVWVGDIDSATRATSKEEAAAALDAAKADVTANLVVEVEPVDVTEVGGRLKALSMRDKIRVAGAPTMPVKATPASVPSQSEQNDVSI